MQKNSTDPLTTPTSRPSASRSLHRLLVAGLATATVVLAFAGVASAHVTVDPSSATSGSFSVLTFRVPNERDDTSTVKVTITFPKDDPLAFASAQPVTGWSTEITKAAPAKKLEVEGIAVDEVVSAMTWSGGEIKPGEFQEFKVSVGPLPDADQLVFDAEQTYSDGEVVDWNQPTPASGEEPEHPAPTVTLTAATGDGHGGSASDDADHADFDTESATSSDEDSDATLATVGVVLGASALVVGVAALLVALRRSKAQQS